MRQCDFEMTSTQAIALLATAGELLLLGLVFRRAKRTPLAPPLIGLSLVLFAWNAATFGYELQHAQGFRSLDLTFSPLSTPLALHFVARFVGRRKRLQLVLVLSYVFFGALSLAAAASFLSGAARAFIVSPLATALHLTGVAAGMSLTVALLVLHIRSSADSTERARTRVLLIAMGLAAICGISELLADLGAPTPKLAALGVLVGNALLVMVALRLQLFDKSPSPADAVFAGVLSLFGVGFVLQSAVALDQKSAVATVAVVTATLVVLAAVRLITVTLREDREQMTQLLNLGRISTQLAHDLKNPLSALRGAAQFLQGEVERGNDVRSQARFFAMLIEQADRMQRVIDLYQRLGRMRPVVTDVSIDALVKQVCDAQAFAAGEKIHLLHQAMPPSPRASVDADLVANALENVLSNAFRALPNGGTVKVETDTRSHDNKPHVVITVTDDGVGMDARTRERAMEDFFSTRPDGTGLGLAFVRRICEAHGGRVTLSSEQGKGTRVALWLPMNSPGDAHG